jgi:hypothetical protein
MKPEIKFGLVFSGSVFNSFWMWLIIMQFGGFVTLHITMMFFSTILILIGVFFPTLVDIVCPKCGRPCKDDHNYCPWCGIKFRNMRYL